MCGLQALRKQGEAGDEKGLVHGSLRVSPPCILSPQHFGKELAPEPQFPGVADMLCDDSRYSFALRRHLSDAIAQTATYNCWKLSFCDSFRQQSGLVFQQERWYNFR
jgi:hypothetical protein